MATAALTYETMPPQQAAAVWWRRKDPYVLTPVAAIHVVALGPALEWVGNASRWPYAQELVTGMIMAQVFLLATWAAFGGLKTLPRLGVVSLVFLSGLVSYLIAARSNLLDGLDSFLEGGLIGALVVSFYGAILLPLRRLLGWRIDFDISHYRSLLGRRGQLGLLDLAALSFALAMPLAAIRLFDEYSTNAGTASEWLWFFSLLVMVAASAAPASYLALRCRRKAAIVVGTAAAALLVGWGHSLLSLWVPDLDFNGGPVNAWGIRLETLAFHAGVAATCTTTFALLRGFGIRLLVVPLYSALALSLRKASRAA